MTAPCRHKVERVLGGAFLGLALALAHPVGGAAQAPPPTERWRTLDTEHFRLTFPEALEALAHRAGARAEEARARIAEAFLELPEGRVEILLTDHVDVSNGFANVTPYRRITLFARPPVDGLALSHFDDWLQLVVTHELAHVVHLDVTGPLGGALRSVFGRVPAAWPFFPELATPGWVIEGLATYYESALTPSGRVHGSYHDMVLRTALAQGRFEDIDEASGDSPVWPGGSRSYIYGSLFFDWLLDRYGSERMADFVEAVGGQWIPYRLNSAARGAFGVSFDDAWDAWRSDLEGRLARTRERIAATAPATPLETLTRGARLGYYPALSPDGRRLVYVRADARDDSQLRLASPDGTGDEKLVDTNGISVFAWAPDGGVVYSQIEYVDMYRALHDLWRVDPDGRVRRLTKGARLDQPAVAPDGRIVALRTEGGTAYLVEVAADGGGLRVLTEPRLDAPWGFPDVSPDGRWIAAVRWSRSGATDVLVLDRDGGEVARVTRDGALDLAPTWAPDGTLLWTSDRSGIPNVYAVAMDGATGRPAGAVRQVTNVLTGVAFPSVDPASRWIYLSEYGVDGWEVARLPYAPAAWFDPQPADPGLADLRGVAYGPAEGRRGGDPTDTVASGPVRDYSPWSSLRPRYWEPLYREGDDVILPGGGRRRVLGPALGASTTAEDLVGRHAFAAALLSTTGGQVDGYLSYRWAGLGNPVLGLGVDQSWDGAGPVLGSTGADTPPDTLFLRERERSVSGSLALSRQRIRSLGRATLSAGVVEERRELLDGSLSPSQRFRLQRPTSRLGDLAATLLYTSARSHGFGLAPEKGARATVRGRLRRELDLADSLSGVVGADRAYQEVVGQAQGYASFPVFGYADHVVAVRAAGGAATGPGADQFHFDVGGAGGRTEGVTGLGLFGGRSYLFPVRGYPNGDRFGRYAWSATAEYRLPVALVNEGWGLLPLHLDRLGASLFLDAGNAWGPELGERFFQNPRRATLASAGAELTARTLAFWSIVLDFRVGVAVPFLAGRDPSVYLRLGPSF